MKRARSGGPRKGYGTAVTAEAIRTWSKLPLKGRMDWIEEMIRLEAALPKRIRDLHAKFRRGEL